jgi:hypothetical protein
MVIKLNVDAVVLKDHRRLAIIARDEYGKMIKAWAKDHVLCDSIMAKDYAILWSVELVRIEMIQNVIFEGDTKVCFDVLNDAYGFVN